MPDSAIVWGLSPALSTMETAARRVPLTVGVKVRLIWQVALAASELPQFWVKLKSPVLSPVSDMLRIFRVWTPVFWTVTCGDGLDFPTG